MENSKSGAACRNSKLVVFSGISNNVHLTRLIWNRETDVVIGGRGGTGTQ